MSPRRQQAVADAVKAALEAKGLRGFAMSTASNPSERRGAIARHPTWAAEYTGYRLGIGISIEVAGETHRHALIGPDEPALAAVFAARFAQWIAEQRQTF